MQNKINKKYVVWIWLGMIFASLVNNVYYIYVNCLSFADGMSGVKIVAEIIYMILECGIVPTALTFLVALIAYSITARKHSNYISRMDFCYWVMIFVSAEYILSGIISGFSILSEPMYIVTSAILDVTLLPCAMLVMYLLISKIYKFNPVEKRNSFKVLSVIFFVILGISVVGENLTVISLAYDGEFYSWFLSYAEAFGFVDEFDYLVTDIQVYSSISAIAIYACWLIADIVLVQLYKKQAGEYQDEDTREDYFAKHPSRNEPYQRRDDVYSTFEEFDESKDSSSDNDDKVFDEFDI